MAQSFVAPPRSIADITAILDKEKPDAKRATKLRADADAKPPAGADQATLARFYYDRSHGHAELGEHREALADAMQAVELGRGSLELKELGRLQQQVALQYLRLGHPKKGLEVLHAMVREHDNAAGRGRLVNTYRIIIQQYLKLGDFERAAETLQSIDTVMQELRKRRDYSGFLRATWECDAEWAQGLLFEARGQFHEAELAYRQAGAFRRESIREKDSYPFAPPHAQLEQAFNLILVSEGRVKARQGHIAEGEADVRRALLSGLELTGKYNLTTARYIGLLTNAMVEQGRFPEAEKLARSQLEIYRGLGLSDDTQSMASTLAQLASILNLQERWQEAAATYKELSRAIASWDAQRRDAVLLHTEYIATLYRTDDIAEGVAAAERLLIRNEVQLGEQHVETALAHGLVGIGYARLQRAADALTQFQQAIPILLARSYETDDDDPTVTAAREQRIQVVVENYIALLALSLVL